MTNIVATPRKRGRPAKAVGDYRETRETLCRAGVAALTEKGFSATGIDEILKSVGVPKGSFYHFFASKEAYGSELITLYARYFVRKLDRFLLD
jgi:TetR/AcrR family transcriptional repressor of nem operon